MCCATPSIVIALILGCSTAAHANSGHTAEFLGWSPNSLEFAYTTKRVRRGKVLSHGFLKAVKRNGRARFKRYKGSVTKRAKVRGYITSELSLVQKSAYSREFALKDGRTLSVVLQVGKRLKFAVYLKGTKNSEKLQTLVSGVFDELWTDFDAQAFVSPNGRWVAIKMMMSTPMRTNHWFEGLRVAQK